MGTIQNLDISPLALVVDDDPVIRMIMSEMLDDLGFEVAEADSVAAALAYLEGNGERVSFLLTDVQMPGSRNGMTLANHVTFVWPHIRILVTSGVSRPLPGQLPGRAQFMSKPVTSAALDAYVSRFSADMLPSRAPLT
ncbi:MAG: response regulator [Candidatus Devosia phytovorans]|uniref:Response regulator n=1 Tax=Candidatus Devosia phytovorans TaxID=3121372 RepID=A0AAJ5VWW0_9HYPH|nr:response regulator [Devosia sp.]WEK04967.1 MAG: response regulator [Devosia sp.]